MGQPAGNISEAPEANISLEGPLDFTAEEIAEALALQGYSCEPVQKVSVAGGSTIESEATTAKAFSNLQPGSGVLVMAQGRYIACTSPPGREAKQGVGIVARDVVSGVERSLDAESFAQYVLHHQCFRVCP